MTIPHNNARRLDIGDATERAAVREAQHAILADLLAAYADGELPAESAARVEAHLVGCTRCRREIGAHVALRERLAAEVVLPAPTSLRDRIVAATAAMPTPAMPRAVPDPSVSEHAATEHAVSEDAVTAPAVPGRSWRWRVGAAIAACAVVAGMGSAALWRGRAEVGGASARAVAPLAMPAGRVPLLAAALADYRRTTAGELPGRARDLDAVRAAVGFPVEPLRAPGFRLLAVWTTTLDGEATAVLAYRHDDRLVLHYLVPESLFFRHPALRAAAAAHRPLAVADGAQAVLAWPEAASGALLVSDGTSTQLVDAVPTLLFGAPSATRGATERTTPRLGSAVDTGARSDP